MIYLVLICKTMTKKIILSLLGLLLVLLSILIFNTLRFKTAPDAGEVSVSIGNHDSAAAHLSRAIQIKTISFGDTLAIDTTEFTQFKSFMETTYPLMHSKLERMVFGEFSYVFKWKGKDTNAAPHVIMAHLDVVPVEAVAESKWTHPPFSGLISQDTIWGRGAVDDKGSAVAIMEATEELLQANHTPERTTYICFGHDEEISGRRGAKVFSKWFNDNNIKPALVVDEGGMIDSEKFKELNRPVAVVGTGEKGYVNIDIAVEIPGGHSSMPSKETAIDLLNKAIVKIRANQMPTRFTTPVIEMLGNTIGSTSFMGRMAMANRWLFEGTIASQMEENNQTNAMIHTTLVPTIVKAGIKDNVIPTVAKATFNSRILPGESSDDVVAFVKKAVNDERVTVTKQTISLMEPSTTTPSSHPAFKQMTSIIHKTVPNVLVSPYLVVGATDSRYFRSFSDAVLNFTPIQNAKGFHGIDERIGVTDLKRMVTYYKLLLSGQ